LVRIIKSDQHAYIEQQDATKTTRPRVSLPERRTRIVHAAEQRSVIDAERIIQQAEARARELVLQATEQAEAICAQAQAEAELYLLKRREQADNEARIFLATNEDKLTRLALKIAEKILARQVELSPHVVRSIVKACLTSVDPEHCVLIRLNPADLPLIQSSIDELLGARSPSSLRLEADSAIARGGCIIESPTGEADGRLSSQLATVARALGLSPKDDPR
jgi:flagellar biosynthesis/type III secretory pathway protein FliH